MTQESTFDGSCGISSARNAMIAHKITEYGEYNMIMSDQSSDIFSTDTYLKPSEERTNKRPSLTCNNKLNLETANNDSSHSLTKERTQFHNNADSNISQLSNRIYCSSCNFDKKSSDGANVKV